MPAWDTAKAACVRKYMITDAQLQEAVAYNSLSNHLETIYKDFGADVSPGSYDMSKSASAGLVQFAADQSFEMGIMPILICMSAC